GPRFGGGSQPGGSGKAAYTFATTSPPSGSSGFATAVAVQPHGKIVGAGYTDGGTVGGANDFAVLRLNPDGSPDPTFGTGGKVTVDFGFDDRATGVVVQPDGK